MGKLTDDLANNLIPQKIKGSMGQIRVATAGAILNYAPTTPQVPLEVNSRNIDPV